VQQALTFFRNPQDKGDEGWLVEGFSARHNTGPLQIPLNAVGEWQILGSEE